MENPEFCEVFSRLSHLPIHDDLVDNLNKFVCLLYGDNCSQSVDECRYNLFIAGKCSDDALPPNSDSLIHHIKRSNFQASSWNRSLSQLMHLPSAVDYGWELASDDHLQILWMTRPSAPESLLEFVQCKCKTGCATKRCSCMRSGLKCTEVCSCSDFGCQNNPKVKDEDGSDTSDDDNDEEEEDLEMDDDDDNMFANS